jgi:hypothetical protein
VEAVVATVNSVEAMVAVTNSVEATAVAIEETMEANLAVDMVAIEEAMEANLAVDTVEIEEAMVVIAELLVSRARTLASWATSVLTPTNVKLR